MKDIFFIFLFLKGRKVLLSFFFLTGERRRQSPLSFRSEPASVIDDDDDASADANGEASSFWLFSVLPEQAEDQLFVCVSCVGQFCGLANYKDRREKRTIIIIIIIMIKSVLMLLLLVASSVKGRTIMSSKACHFLTCFSCCSCFSSRQLKADIFKGLRQQSSSFSLQDL